MDPGNFNSIRSVSEALHRSSEMSEQVKATEHSQPSVSFAMDQPTPTSYFGSRIIPSSTEQRSLKQTKSILKKTEVGSSTTTANNSNTNSNINPSSVSASNLLKDATHQNSFAIQTNSPPKKGLGSSVSEVEIILSIMKNLSETSPIEE